MRSDDVIQGRFRLVRPLGAGGQGAVWLAEQIDLGRMVAIKFLKQPSSEQLDRFEREARSLARLSHPNCVAVHDFGRAESGTPFLVMEHVPGQSLATLRGQRLPVDEVVEIAAQVADALACAHDHGIVHRDLKPENIVTVGEPPHRVAKVLDFGLAKLVDRELPDITETHEVFGTPAYMSPEQLRGSKVVGGSTDLYALGVILFELLDGRLPFRGDSPWAIGMAHLQEQAPPMSGSIPAGLRQLVASLLEKDPSRRPHSAHEVRDRLLALIERPTLGTAGFAFAFAAVALVIATGWWMMSVEPPPSETIPAVPRPNPLAPDETAPPARADFGADIEASDCAPEPPFRGTGDLFTDELEPTRILTVVPRSYDARRRHPVIFLLHEDAQDPEDILKDTGFAALTEHGVIVAVPQADHNDEPHPEIGRTLPTWGVESSVEGLEAAVLRVQQVFCVDADRIFAVGQATGASSPRGWRATCLSSRRSPPTRSVESRASSGVSARYPTSTSPA